MRRLITTALLLFLSATWALAQTGSPKNTTALNTETNTSFADNTTGAITPFLFRQMMLDMIASSGNLNTPNLVLSGGATVVSFGIGTVSSGTTTINCGNSPLQFLTNGGSFTMAAPTADGSCIVLVTNSATAGTVLFSGFSEGSNTGDATDVINGHSFAYSIVRINGISHYLVSAYQ